MIYEVVAAISPYLTKVERYMCRLTSTEMNLAIQKSFGNEKIDYTAIIRYGASVGSISICEYVIRENMEKIKRTISLSNGGNFVYLSKVIYKQNTYIVNKMMYYAARKGFINICLFAFEKGAVNINKMLLWAARNGHIDICKFALGKGATNVNEMLCEASAMGHADIYNLAVKRGALDIGEERNYSHEFNLIYAI